MKLLASAGQWVLSAAPALAFDAAGLAGCGLIIYGAWRIYEPAGFISAGAMLLVGAWMGARRA